MNIAAGLIYIIGSWIVTNLLFALFVLIGGVAKSQRPEMYRWIATWNGVAHIFIFVLAVATA